MANQIPNLIVRGGYGPTASIALLVTHGLGVFSPTPPGTGLPPVQLSISLAAGSFGTGIGIRP